MEEGFPSEDEHDLLSLRIQLILTDELLCTIPFDEQTMEHIRALVGAYLALLTENYEHRFVKIKNVNIRIIIINFHSEQQIISNLIYRRSLHQTHRPTPLSFFVMTTKRLLNDVSILKEEKEERGKKNQPKMSADSDNDVQIGVTSSNTRKKRRDTTASARLSYSSTSTSSSAGSMLSFAGPPSVLDIISGSATRQRASQSSLDYPKNKNSIENSMEIAHQGGQKESKLNNAEGSYEAVEGEARRISSLERDQSPVNTSFESELTPANSNTASNNSSSSSSNNSSCSSGSAWPGKGSDVNDTTARRSKRIRCTSNV